ncbi:MAG: outer membrane protein [Marinoscillum sp.]|jgi:outer membrane protein
MRIFTLILFILSAWSNGHAQDPNARAYSLQECVDIAIENNLTVRRSELQKLGAEINMNQAKASRLPDLNIGGNTGYNWGRSIDPTSNQFISQQISFSGVSANSGMTLFNWFRITNTIKQNKLLVESADYGVDKAKNDISLMVVTLFLNVVFNQELYSNSEYQLISSQEQLERTKKLVEAGSLPMTSQLELVSQVATNEVQLINAENSLQLAKLDLKQMMLLPSFDPFEVVVPTLSMTMTETLNITPEELFTAAVQAMPEIRSAELQVEGAAMGVKVAEAGYTPQLTLNGSMRTNYSDAFVTYIPNADNPFTIDTDANGNTITRPTLFQTTTGTAVEQISVSQNGTFETVSFGDQFDQNLSRSLSLNLSVPVFNNLRTTSSVQRAKIALQQAEITVLEQRNQLRQTIESAYNDAQAAFKTFAASSRQVEALEETFRSITNQYNLGAANFTDFQVASNNLFRAKSDLVRAKYDYIFKLKVLDFYQGKSLTL